MLGFFSSVEKVFVHHAQLLFDLLVRESRQVQETNDCSSTGLVPRRLRLRRLRRRRLFRVLMEGSEGVVRVTLIGLVETAGLGSRVERLDWRLGSGSSQSELMKLWRIRGAAVEMVVFLG